MTAIAIELLSDRPAHGEAARELLERSFRLPDAWARHGGVPDELPQRFADEIAAFPGDARPPAGDVVVATVESRPVAAGHIVAARSRDACEFKRVLVEPEHRRLGIGTLLVEAMLARARALGYDRVMLDVIPERTGAIAFWARAGFAPTAPYRDYPFEMVFMARRLDRQV